MGSRCTPARKPKGTKLPEYQEYIDLKKKVFSSPKFLFIKTFYQDLFYVAQNIIKISAKFDKIIKDLHSTKQAIDLFKSVNALDQVATILAIIPQSILPMIQQSRDPIFQSLGTATKFAEEYHDFQDDLYTLFKLLPLIETSNVMDPKSRYQHGINILKCLQERLEAINEIEFEKENLVPFKKLLNMINAIKKITGLVAKLHKYLGTKVMGMSVLSLLGSAGGGGGLKGVIIKMALKGLSLPIKAAIKKLVTGSSKVFKYDFPFSFFKPESGWLGIHFAYDKKSKKLDLFSCLPQQWAKKNLGDKYKEGKFKEYEKIRRAQTIFLENGERVKDQDEDVEQTQFVELKLENTVDPIPRNYDKNEKSDDHNEEALKQDKQQGLQQNNEENVIKEVKKSVSQICNEINFLHESIREKKVQNQEDEKEVQWDESQPEIDDERDSIIEIPKQKKKVGTGSVLGKSILLNV